MMKKKLQVQTNTATTSNRKKQVMQIEQDDGSSKDCSKVEIKRLGYIFYRNSNLKFNCKNVQIFK